LMARGGQTSQLGMGSQLLAGGVAGAMFWLFVYPADVIKSRIQVDTYPNPQYKGTIDAFRKVYAAEGVKGLYRGFGPAMARSVPANAVCFFIYDLVRKQLS
jgi:solute carrier family 25 carnitine/acylcarnitine transporter 20/29